MHKPCIRIIWEKSEVIVKQQATAVQKSRTKRLFRKQRRPKMYRKTLSWHDKPRGARGENIGTELETIHKGLNRNGSSRTRWTTLRDNGRRGCRDHFGGHGSLTETVLESTVHIAQVTHAASARCASPLALRRPVEDTLTCTWVATARTFFLLNVI